MIYIYKEDLALNNLHGLICHKTKQNQTIKIIEKWSKLEGSNEQLQQQLEYTLLNTDYCSWWISKMQSQRADTLEERYAIKFVEVPVV